MTTTAIELKDITAFLATLSPIAIPIATAIYAHGRKSHLRGEHAHLGVIFVAILANLVAVTVTACIEIYTLYSVQHTTESIQEAITNSTIASIRATVTTSSQSSQSHIR